MQFFGISTSVLKCLFIVLTLPALANGQDNDTQTPAVDILAELADQVVDIHAKDGYFTDAKIFKLEPGKSDDSIKQIRFKIGDNSKRIKGSRVIEIFRDGQPLDLAYDKQKKGLIHDPQKRTDRLTYEIKINDRLSSTGHSLWKPLSQQEQLDFLRKQESFVAKIRNTMPGVNWRMVETNYFIFLTDLAPDEVDGYIVYLDAMYQELCQAFGIPPEKNIWCGKCMVVAFRDEQTYLLFEANVMDYNKAAGTQGLCHQQRDGSVLFAGYKGTNNFFGHVLVHETSHGFVHRYLSSARAPSWLNEGMADWLAHQVVRGDQITRRQRQSANKMKAKGGLGDIFKAKRINGDQYGVSSVLVGILLSRDRGEQFKQFFDGIKEGDDPEKSLKDHFKLSYLDLEILYGQMVSNWN